MNIKEKFVNFGAYPHYLKRLLVLTCERMLDLKDLFLLQRRLQLKNFRVVYNKSRAELEPYYQEYIAQVSEDKHAISLELGCPVFRSLCHIKS